MPRLSDISGIEQAHSEKLADFGVGTTSRLLDIASHKRGRADLAEDCRISEKLILEWVHMADLMRVEGVGEGYGVLLKEAGVKSLKDLRKRRPERLHNSMVELNARDHLVRRLPSLSDVRKWVSSARKTRDRVTF